MNTRRKRKRGLAVLFCCIGIGGALAYTIREWRLRQLAVAMEREFAAVETRRRRNEAALLPVGGIASDFVLKTTTGASLALKEVRRTHKAVLLDFWFYACGPCQEETPLLVALQNTLGRQGLAVISLNHDDPPSVLHAWANRHHVRFPVVMAGRNALDRGETLRKYRVSAYPTHYLIDSQGRVLWRGVGVAEEAALRAAFAQAGLSSDASPVAQPSGKRREK